MRDRRPIDLVTKRVALPDAGLGRGWEGPALFGITLLLLSFGLVTLYSASVFMAQQAGLPDHYYVLRQATGAAVGLVALVVCGRFPYRLWEPLAWPMLWVSVVLLLLVILPFTQGISHEANGARRWLDLGILFQPSDLAKISVITWTAMLAVRKQGEFRSLGRGLAPFLLIWGVVLIPILLQPNLSTALLIGTVAALMVFAAGGRIAHFAFLAALALPVVAMQLASCAPEPSPGPQWWCLMRLLSGRQSRRASVDRRWSGGPPRSVRRPEEVAPPNFFSRTTAFMPARGVRPISGRWRMARASP